MNGDGMNQERRLPNILIFVATAFTTVSYGLALDAFLMQQGLSGRTTLYVSNLLIGAAAGAWVVQRRLLQHHKQRALKERIEFISEMNQHIRSVLTSLSLYGKHNGGAHAEVLSELLRRVEINLADMFGRLLFDRSLPLSTLTAAKNTLDSMAR
jgi:hypothetical protein